MRIRVARNGMVMAIATAMSVLAFAAPAQAVNIIESQSPGGEAETAKAGWQAGVCNVDPCSAETPGLFFTQAAGHPPKGFTQIIVRHSGAFEEPQGNLKTVLVDLPAGLSVNPQATPQCTLEGGKFPAAGCPVTTQVGESAVTASLVPLPPLPLSTPPVTIPGLAVYNLVPRAGEPARFGFTLPLGLGEVFLNAGVEWNNNYHEYFTIHVPSVPAVRILKNRLVFNGQIGQLGSGGAFLTNPSTCENPAVEPFKAGYSTYLHADSVEESAPDDSYDVAAPAPPSAAFLAGSQLLGSPLPKGAKPEGCNKIPFTPGVSTDPGTTQTDSPSGAAVAVTVPFDPAANVYQSNLKDARVTLPEGMGLNPSATSGLQTCTDNQFGKGTRSPVSCPAASKVGVVSLDTPVLPAGTLTGNVYVGQQINRDPTSGNEYRIFIDAESAARGLSIRLVGNVKANPTTGQLTTEVLNNPQLPFSNLTLNFDDGQKSVLSSPPTCGPNATSGQMTPWSGNPNANPSSSFSLTKAPGGGACAKTLAARPFGPSFSAKSTNPKGGAYTQLNVSVTRNDGNQELKGVNVALPPGLTAKLAGVPYCPPANFAAAANKAGAAEAKTPSCPDASQLGSAVIQSGTGTSPTTITGKAYLMGPYKGAPLSLGIITPATAGPFDLGTVIVRVALEVNPETAQVTAISDPIPHVYGGALLDIRSIALKIERKEFGINPTNCEAMVVNGGLRGGGSDPNNPAAFSTALVQNPFQVSNCDQLEFKPKLKIRLFGKHNRAQHPRLRAVLTAREGDANIKRASVALPHALLLDQASLSTICTRPEFAAEACPARSRYGWAKAETPLLAKPVEGPVYLRSSNNKLPDLVAAMSGQVDINLVGRIDTFKGGIRTTFDSVPDVPVSNFTLNLPGGGHGLIVSSRNLCQKPVRAVVQLKGQNGKKKNWHPKLGLRCKGAHGKKHPPHKK